jgi:hypothetical protein
MIIFTPLTGSSQNPNRAGIKGTSPVSHLLELDDVKILLDLGGRDPRLTSEAGYDLAYEKKIKE